MNLRSLRDELIDDQLGRDYASMTDAQAATSLNTPNRPTERAVVPTYDLFDAIVPAEWAALSAVERQRVETVLSLGSVNLRGANTRASLMATFGAPTTTRANLIALQAGENISRAEELGLPRVGAHHVARARAGEVE